jgi:hypothetical protein
MPCTTQKSQIIDSGTGNEGMVKLQKVEAYTVCRKRSKGLRRSMVRIAAQYVSDRSHASPNVTSATRIQVTRKGTTFGRTETTSYNDIREQFST